LLKKIVVLKIKEYQNKTYNHFRTQLW